MMTKIGVKIKVIYLSYIAKATQIESIIGITKTYQVINENES